MFWLSVCGSALLLSLLSASASASASGAPGFFFDSQTLSVDVAPYYVHFILGLVHSVCLFGGGETPVYECEKT
jgi:hypothetical protein